MKPKNETQIQRYQKLLSFIDEKFKEEISIPDIEAVCHYSYRNINRIFEALHQETIGKYIKRIKLEKAAQHIKYSSESFSNIAYDMGFADLATFSKAFKNHFHCTPTAFREGNKIVSTHLAKEATNGTTISFELESLPAFDMLGLSYRGLYEDIEAIKKTWQKLVDYLDKKNMLRDDNIFLAEILDDDTISEAIHCRYNVGIVRNEPLPFDVDAYFSIKTIPRRRYAKFVHKGSHESCLHTYQKIYSSWMTEVQLEMADAPVLEFFLNDEANTPAEDLLTEIYIPVL